MIRVFDLFPEINRNLSAYLIVNIHKKGLVPRHGRGGRVVTKGVGILDKASICYAEIGIRLKRRPEGKYGYTPLNE